MRPRGGGWCCTTHGPHGCWDWIGAGRHGTGPQVPVLGTEAQMGASVVVMAGFWAPPVLPFSGGLKAKLCFP